MNNVFICHTPYHLLISVIKTLLNNRIGQDDLLLCEEESISKDSIKRISEKKLFKTIHICTLKQYTPVTWKEKLFSSNYHLKKRMFDSCNIDLDFFYNKTIFLFNDQCTLGKWFCIFKIKYNLLEDGCNHFQIHSSTYIKKSFFRYIDQLLGVCTEYPMGYSPFIQSIEVNDSKGLRIKSTKIKVQSKTELFKKLNPSHKAIISNIFILPNFYYKIKKNSSLLITQPLFEDGILSHGAKISLYKHLIKTYGEKNIYIKPHPRENEDYSKYFPNATIITENKIPLEVIFFNDNNMFENVITAYSTAIYSLPQISQKIYFGYENTLEFAKGITPNK